ncbi:NTP/NDP exchange transporter [Luteimonas saliphila]|uniref:NTP/NDP exchange transporter n=1 Tax=Luteimonas saliphila TaxID=2804919 RepID=UPI00192D9809|nr:MFS transporter [Luteimonas saliphila]
MPTATLARRLGAAINAERHELAPALTGFALFFCLFSGYFMLRPVRESMGIMAGVEHLQWLFTATFVSTLAVVPLFAWLGSRVPRRHFADWVYGVFCVNLLAFAGAFHFAGESVWIARAFYVWISVYNLFVVSVTWSLMADVFDGRQARRLFAFIAAGASVGGLVGPAASALLVGATGEAGLVLLAGLLLGLALALKAPLMRWRETGGAGRPGAPPAESTRRPIAGNPFSGMTRVLRSPYLLAVGAFVVLLATVTTFLYFEQARFVAGYFPDRASQIRVFGLIDVAVQAGALGSQLFVTGRIAQKLGVRVLLAIVPIVVCMGFIGLALAPSFAMLAALMIVRRIGEHAFVRPGREMLFAPLDAESKYKAKGFIDTVVYRAGDAGSAWVKSALDLIGQGTVLVALVGAACALAWGGLGWLIGRRADRMGGRADTDARDHAGPQVLKTLAARRGS